jgi:hypothetical protein
MMVPVALGSRLRGNDEKGAGWIDEGVCWNDEGVGWSEGRDAVPPSVIPAKAGTQDRIAMTVPVALGSRLRGNDEKRAGRNDEGVGGMTGRGAVMTSEKQETY